MLDQMLDQKKASSSVKEAYRVPVFRVVFNSVEGVNYVNNYVNKDYKSMFFSS